MLIEMKSMLTGKINKMEIPVTEYQLANWKASGMLIQEAFPDLTSEQREFLLTGSTSEEWNSIFFED
jgi:hypothetical protein